MILFTYPAGEAPDLLVASDGRAYLAYQRANGLGLIVYSFPIASPASWREEFSDIANEGCFARLVDSHRGVVVGYRAKLTSGDFGVKGQNITLGTWIEMVAEVVGNSPFVWSDSEVGYYGAQTNGAYSVDLFEYPMADSVAHLGVGAPTGLARLTGDLFLTCDQADTLYPGVTSPSWSGNAIVGQWKDGGIWCNFAGKVGVILRGQYTGNPRVQTLPDGSFAIAYWVAGSHGPTSVVALWNVTAADLSPLEAPIDTPIDPVDPVDPVDPDPPIVILPPPHQETPQMMPFDDYVKYVRTVIGPVLENAGVPNGSGVAQGVGDTFRDTGRWGAKARDPRVEEYFMLAWAYSRGFAPDVDPQLSVIRSCLQ